MSSLAAQNILANYAAYKATQQPTNSSSNQPSPRPLPNLPISSLGPSPMGSAPTVMSIIHNPLPAPPEITISQSTLEKSDSERASIGLPPLESIMKINVLPEKTQDNTFSQGTNQFRSDQTDLIKQLQEAKDSGITSLQIIDKDGNITTTNPQNITKARYDILRKSIDSGDSVQVKYSTNIPQEKPSAVLGEAGAKQVYGDNFGEFLKGGQSTFNSYIDSLTGKQTAGPTPLNLTLSGLTTGALRELDVLGVKNPFSSTGTFASGEMRSPGDIINSGIGQAGKLIQDRPYYSLGSILGEIGIQGATLGLGEAAGVGLKALSAYRTANAIAKPTGLFARIGKGLQEGKLGYNVEEKGPIAEFSQGTEGVSGISEFVPKPVSYLERIGSNVKSTLTDIGGGKTVETKEVVPDGREVQTVTAKPLIPETIDVTGVGPKGEPVQVKAPNVVKLEPGVEGVAKNPYAVFSKDVVAITKSEPSELAPHYFMTDPLQGITKEQADYIGLEALPGRQGVYFGEATPEVQSKIFDLIQGGKLKVGTDTFLYPTQDIEKNVARYAEATRTPELFTSGLFEGLTRPTVVKYLIGGGKYPLKVKPLQTVARTKKNLRPFTAGSLPAYNFGGPGVAGSAARASSLIQDIVKERYPLMTSHLPKETANILKESPKYYPTVLTGSQKQRGRNRVTEETLYLAYPPQTKLDLSKISKNIIDIKTDSRLKQILDNALDQVTRTRTISKQEGKTRNTGRTNTRGLEITIPAVDTIPRQGSTTRQRTDTVVIRVPKIPPGQTPTKQKTTETIVIPEIMFPIIGGTGGGGTRRKKSTKATQFVYSVNPEKVGAIAEAGFSGKTVGQIGQNIDKITSGYKIKTVKIKKQKMNF